MITKSECYKEIVEEKPVKEETVEEKQIPIPIQDVGEKKIEIKVQDHIRLLSCFNNATKLASSYYTRETGLNTDDIANVIITLTEKLYKGLNKLIIVLKDGGDLK